MRRRLVVLVAFVGAFVGITAACGRVMPRTPDLRSPSVLRPTKPCAMWPGGPPVLSVASGRPNGITRAAVGGGAQLRLAVGDRTPLPGPLPVPLVRGEAGAQPNWFFDSGYFYPGLEGARGAPAGRGEGLLVGGVTSHHGVAGGVIAQLFLEVGEKPPATVVLVGPNHENRGQQVITGRRSWGTDFGLVEADLALVDRLVDSGLATVDEETLSGEHAMGTLMPYVKYLAPHTRVVPLILSRSVSISEVRALAALLAPEVGPDRLLIASVDFSHYLKAAEAEQNDEATLAAIQQMDLEELWRMGPDYLDSPPSLGLLLLTMQATGARGPEIAAHTNSGRLAGKPELPCTSYFTFKYRVPVGK